MLEPFKSLGVALAIGLLIGIERGWTQREVAEGGRVAGLRTFGLIGLLAGVMTLLAETYGGWMIAVGFVALAALLGVAHWRASLQGDDHGVTTEVAALLTYLLGVVGASGRPAIAAAGAVVSVWLLGQKRALHGLLKQLYRYELVAGLQMALISLVVLPVLPDRGMGPWQVVNPYELWLMVVLISAISFCGHFAVRIVGARRGLLLTGLFAGLASSTALTLSFSRLARDHRGIQRVLAAGVVIAGTTMFPRILLEVAVVHRPLLDRLLWPALALTAVGLGGGLLLWGRETRDASSQRSEDFGFDKPFELRTAVQFALLLAAVLFLSEAAHRVFGSKGIYVVSLLSGLTDVDAITLSLSRLARGDLADETAARGVLLAALANTVFKGAMVAFIAKGRMARSVGAVFGVILLVGVALISVPGLIP